MPRAVHRLARLSPRLANWAWWHAYPFFRRDELFDGEEYQGDRGQTFTTIFEENRWGSDESVSGFGSTLHQTLILRRELPRLLTRLGARTLLDAPCGDFNWMSRLPLPDGVSYIGGEIVRPLVKRLNRRFGSPTRHFVELDIVSDPLPPADLWLCRDVLFHLSADDIHKALENFARSDVTYLLTTYHPFVDVNRDIRSGGFRFLNLTIAPFNLPQPTTRVDDFLAPEPPRKLGLWHRDQVARALRG